VRDNGIDVTRRIHLKLSSGAGGQPTPASRIKGIAIGLFCALAVAALLFVALILGSIIAVVIGILLIATIAFVIVRGTLLGSVGSDSTHEHRADSNVRVASNPESNKSNESQE